MSLNWVEINQVLAELNLVGSVLQNVRQADWQTYYFEFYRPGRRFDVLVSLTPQKLRLHEVLKRRPTLVRPPRFAEFLRARLVGCRVIESQQYGTDRLVLWRFQNDSTNADLWIRLWGGAANLLVTDGAGTILEAAFRRPKSGEVSGSPFRPPEIANGAPTRDWSLRDLPAPEGDEKASYSRRLELWYDAEQPQEVEKLRDQALRFVERRVASLEQSRDQVLERLKEAGRADDYKAYADLLTSEAWSLSAGATVFETTDWRDGSRLRLSLDPQLSAYENAQRWYKKYQKARDGAQAAHGELTRIESEIQVWTSRAEPLEGADATELQTFLNTHRPTRTLGSVATRNPRPGLGFESGGFTLWVGRNAKENDALLRRWVRGNDLWFHTRDVPGGYVFVRAQKGKSVPLQVMLDAGMLAVTFSKAKSEGRADLYYTAVKYLRRPASGPVGKVLPTQEKNLFVIVDPVHLERIFRTKQEEA